MSADRRTTDVAIIGGAMTGSAVAWWLTRDPAFTGRVTIIERDPTYEWAATTHTNSCIRQQFGSEINIRLSQFTLSFMRDIKDWMGEDAPSLPVQSFGYLYLARDEQFANVLREARDLQVGLGASTEILTRQELSQRFPFYVTDDVVLASHGTRDEGYFDGNTLFQLFNRQARQYGATVLHDEVVGIEGTDLRLASGATLSAGTIVNAAGPRAAEIARMAGSDLPVEPRKRYSFVFDAAEPLPVDLPLTIDPSGVHVRQEGRYYLAGCPPDDDAPVAPDDFELDHAIWEEKVWPALAARIPAFERIKLMQSWVGHYDFNHFDQNAILGRHPDAPQLITAAGFSGHGLQQAAGIARGIAELIVHGQYRSLDLSPLGIERIHDNRPARERAVI
ncbi:Glycine/D-amino acid oxidase (deaminating) [Oceanicola granulosus HTCC2516]|uniref:Glycine/D-amino acid oxidase (Deaminating) n=1 Tax=Oceanicola granulosus (strain ATCC BAA-861 / DSM 15982 / KCTC 12143 / HTCC2516) TaxID=314256 RepID=Q2CI79_OCEGH|nr:FAD-dependent oxidoreductase [Oceanicola granulosus]EAR52379.1 Glycine/D-amino acid oxidase (deaminating) [Oceanicola granulosus HTCC2516]